MPSGEEIAPLMRWYGYRFNRTGVAVGAERQRLPEDEALLARFGRTVGVEERCPGAEIVDRAIAAAEALTPDAVLAAWVAGLGSAPRGRQTAVSWGWSWNELAGHYLPDLEAAVAEELPHPTAVDREQRDSLLELIASMPAGTTPGELEKAVARAKLVPGTDKYRRYGILIGLSEIGVLPSDTVPPNWDQFVPVRERWAAPTRASARSDIPHPLAGWRGGVDDRRAALLRAV